jgi:transposase-like protein
MEDRRYALVRYGKTGRKPEVYHHSIVALYGPTKGNASDAARRLGCNRSTIRDHWRKQGLTPKGRKLSKEISLLRARHAALETIR